MIGQGAVFLGHYMESRDDLITIGLMAAMFGHHRLTYYRNGGQRRFKASSVTNFTGEGSTRGVMRR